MGLYLGAAREAAEQIRPRVAPAQKQTLPLTDLSPPVTGGSYPLELTLTNLRPSIARAAMRPRAAWLVRRTVFFTDILTRLPFGGTSRRRDQSPFSANLCHAGSIHRNPLSTFASCFPGFVRREFVGATLFVRRAATLAGDLSLLLRVHGRKPPFAGSRLHTHVLSPTRDYINVGPYLSPQASSDVSHFHTRVPQSLMGWLQWLCQP